MGTLRDCNLRAQIFEEVGKPLVLEDIPIPKPTGNQVLVKVEVCGVCRTDLHIIDGELKSPQLPLILGHQIVGTVVKGGNRFKPGTRIGVPWLGSTCHECRYCLAKEENLCDAAKFTGYTLQGGYADYCVADENYCFELPENIDSIQAAPLLCAGLIGFRAYRKIDWATRIGFYGFGSSAHILAQLAAYEKKEIYAFTKKGDNEGQEFAKKLGCVWAGSSDEDPPFLLDAAILFAPVGALYPKALENLRKGGTVISAGIHMSPIPSFSYDLLWEERVMTSVANLTREDGHLFFDRIKDLPLHVQVTAFPLEQANEALEALKKGSDKGSIVLLVS